MPIIFLLLITIVWIIDRILIYIASNYVHFWWGKFRMLWMITAFIFFIVCFFPFSNFRTVLRSLSVYSRTFLCFYSFSGTSTANIAQLLNGYLITTWATQWNYHLVQHTEIEFLDHTRTQVLFYIIKSSLIDSCRILFFFTASQQYEKISSLRKVHFPLPLPTPNKS